jgi:hypothetical protein
MEIVSVYLSELRIFRARLITALAQPFRRGALDLPSLRMHGTANTHHCVYALDRLHDGGHSSQERRCDEGRPGYQSVTPAQHSMQCS